MQALYTLSSLLLLLPVFATLAAANSPLPDDLVQASLASPSERGLELAMASRPMWHFATMRPPFYTQRKRTCYPTSALNSTGQQHGTQPQAWPNAGDNCVDPGPSGQGRPFPTYWNVKQCTHDEIRVIYSLYSQHDGFSNVIVAKGHMHDWERIVVIWKRDAGTSSWTRASVLKSMHSGYESRSWSSIQSTFDHANPGESGGKNKDGAKIYSGWAKHPFFDTKETKWRDSISQGCQREFRNDEWWYMPQFEDMVWAAKESPEGQRLAGFSWGAATGGPWVVEEGICAKGEGGFVKC